MAKTATNKTKTAKKSIAKPATKKVIVIAGKELTSEGFIKRLKTMTSAAELKKIQGYFKSGEGQYAIRINPVPALAIRLHFYDLDHFVLTICKDVE